MYANEDPYGDEIEGDEDRNDGLNALVCLKNFNFIRTFNGLLDSIKTSIKAFITSLPMKDM